MASATGIPEQNPARDEEEPLLGRPGDVTQKPDEGFQWNIITGKTSSGKVDWRTSADRDLGTAAVAQAGTWILAALVWAAVFEADFSFFSYHPVRLTS